jgi:hypothetical protein
MSPGGLWRANPARRAFDHLGHFTTEADASGVTQSASAGGVPVYTRPPPPPPSPSVLGMGLGNLGDKAPLLVAAALGVGAFFLLRKFAPRRRAAS